MIFSKGKKLTIAQKLFVSACSMIWCFSQKVENWQRHKSRALPGHFPVIKTKGWFVYPDTCLLHKDYGWKRDDLKRLLNTSPTIEAFTNSFFEPVLQNNSASIWVEKTPSNAYSFQHFLKHFPEGKIVQVVRNPLDVSASLVRRDFPPFFAAGTWIYNTAAAIVPFRDSRYHLVKYEDLVANPEAVVKALIEFLNLDFEPEILTPQKDETPSKNEKMSGWKFSPQGGIQSQSVGSFDKLSTQKQAEIITCLSAIEISEKHRKVKNLPFVNCRDLCRQLGYEFQPQLKSSKAALYFSYFSDVVKRTLKGYPTHIFNYPAKINFNWSKH